MDHLLVYNPNERFNCEQALVHPFLTMYHDEDDEPIGEPFIDHNDLVHHSVNEWKGM